MRYHVHRFEKHHLEKNAFNHWQDGFHSISRRSSENSKFQRKRLPVGIGSFVSYSRRSKRFFKPIKKNYFFEKFTVIYPLKSLYLCIVITTRTLLPLELHKTLLRYFNSNFSAADRDHKKVQTVSQALTNISYLRDKTPLFFDREPAEIYIWLKKSYWKHINNHNKR